MCSQSATLKFLTFSLRQQVEIFFNLVEIWLVFLDGASFLHMGIIDEWYTVFQKIKIPHGSILPVGLISQTFGLYFPAFTLARC